MSENASAHSTQSHSIQILEEAFDPSAIYQQLSEQSCTKDSTESSAENGALVTFTGMVRDLAEAPVNAMFLEHYPGMTERALEDIIHKARARWSLGNIHIVHRVGMLYPGDPIVFIGVSSGHRHEAFEACQFLMDYLKTEAPFWKKEFTPNGEQWIEAKCSDAEAAKRW